MIFFWFEEGWRISRGDLLLAGLFPAYDQALAWAIENGVLA